MESYPIIMHYRYEGKKKSKEFTIPLAAIITRRISIMLENMLLIVDLTQCLWSIQENRYVSNIGDLEKDSTDKESEDEIIVGV